MAFFDKEYKYASQNNFDGLLRALGVPEEIMAKYKETKSTSKLTKSGDSYTYTSSGPEGVKQTTFKSGVEFDDTIQGVAIKTKYTVNGNTVTQEISSEKGTATIKREYNGDELLLTITSSKWDGVATRTYKA